LYTNWNNAKSRIFKSGYFGLKNKAWHHLVGIQLDEEYDISDIELLEIIQRSNTFENFVDSFYKLILKRNSKTYWIEKTPSNAFSVHDFLDLNASNSVVHIVRNPYDTMASLVNRGMSVYNACAVYLLNTSEVLAFKNHERSYLLSYENLIDAAEAELSKLLQFLHFEFESGMLDSKTTNIKGVNKMEGWNYAETSAIGKKSVGRFSDLPETLKLDILTAAETMVSSLGNGHDTVRDICNTLNYDCIDIDHGSVSTSSLKKQMFADKLIRSLKRSYFNASNYPISIRR
jgi:hypothetical protein